MNNSNEKSKIDKMFPGLKEEMMMEEAIASAELASEPSVEVSKSKELPKGVCPSCWGKKYNSVMNRETGMGDFIGDPDYDSGSHIDNIPCSKCKGTGLYPTPSVEVSVCCGAMKSLAVWEGNGVCSNCRKPFEPQSIPLERCVDTTCSRNHNHLGVHWEEYYNPTPKLTPESTEMEEWIEFSDSGTVKTYMESRLHNCWNHSFFARTESEIKESRDELWKLVNDILSSHSQKLVKDTMTEVKEKIVKDIENMHLWSKGTAEGTRADIIYKLKNKTIYE